MIVVNSLSENNVYFIFRDDNKEIKVDVSSGRIRANHKLRPEERKYFYDEILMFDDLNDEIDEESESINNLAEQGYTDYAIAKRLYLNVSSVARITDKFWKDRMKNKRTKIMNTDVLEEQSDQFPNITLEQAITKAKPNLDKITNVDKYLDDIR